MIKKHQKHIAVQQAVMIVMEQYRSSWQAVAELSAKYDRYIRNLKKTEDHIAVLQTDLAPYKSKRKRARVALTESVFPITSVLGVYAHDAGDRKLGRSLRIKYSDLEKMNADQLKSYGIRVLKLCERLFNPQPETGRKSPKHFISDYGLTDQHLEGLKNTIDNFIRADVDFREIRSRRRKSKAKLKKRIRENKELLKSMDRMIHLFRGSQKSFYGAYINSRIPGEPEPASPVASEETAMKAAKPAEQAAKPVEQAAKPAEQAAKPATTKARARSVRAKRPVGRPRKTPARVQPSASGKSPAPKGRGGARKP